MSADFIKYKESENSMEFSKVLREIRKELLGYIQTLKEYNSKVRGELTNEDKKIIVEQALVLLEECYVHLPLKKAMHAVDPIQKLKLIAHKLEERDWSGMWSEWAFHKEMIEIFNSVRDLHTNYFLPSPFASYIAFLPFTIECYYDEENNRQFIVTKIAEGFERILPETFKPGIKITHWNGIPILRAVEINANKNAGSNQDASFARGLHTMTNRPLMTSFLPDEEWVDIDYITEDGNDADRFRLDWLVFSRTSEHTRAMGSKFRATPSSGFTIDASKNKYKMGLDITTQLVNEVNKILFAPIKILEAEKRLSKSTSFKELLGEVQELESYMPEVISVRKISADVGYIRIYGFSEDKYENFVEQFINEFLRLLKQLPKKGLILDVRGNGGGYITAAECLLQFFTPRKIVPEPFQFISSPLTVDMTRKIDWLAEWSDSLSESVTTGSTFSRGVPITSMEEANSLGQQYHGPVILLTDALCYSATDLFAAGFQDHKIGPIMGVDGNTGAGGANVWTYGLIKDTLELTRSKHELKRLPLDMEMRVSMRRNIRVGDYYGTPIEDIGIRPDYMHYLTKKDLLESNVDLINKAVDILTHITYRQFDVTISKKEGSVEVEVDTIGISRIDVYVDKRPVNSQDAVDGKNRLDVKIQDTNAKILELYGIALNKDSLENEVVAAKKIFLSQLTN